MSIEYYDNNSQSFFDDTFHVDMGELYEQFLQLVPHGGHILDAGCGSGRDALFFSNLGYQVTAIDGSCKLSKIASKNTGLAVKNLLFENMDFIESFDAIWASASLLHIHYDNLPEIFNKFYRSLKPKGVIYCSFKYGDSLIKKDGRSFTNMNSRIFSDLLGKNDKFVIVEVWITGDKRAERKRENWFNAILEKR